MIIVVAPAGDDASDQYNRDQATPGSLHRSPVRIGVPFDTPARMPCEVVRASPSPERIRSGWRELANIRLNVQARRSHQTLLGKRFIHSFEQHI
jgi:hypothetical protein